MDKKKVKRSIRSKEDFASDWLKRMANKMRVRKWRKSHTDYNKNYRETHQKERREYYLTHREKAIEEVKKWKTAHRRRTNEIQNQYQRTLKGKTVKRKIAAKKKGLGFVPLNEPFEGAASHHIDRERVIYIPRKLHESIQHNLLRNHNMDKINKEAFSFSERGKH